MNNHLTKPRKRTIVGLSFAVMSLLFLTAFIISGLYVGNFQSDSTLLIFAVIMGTTIASIGFLFSRSEFFAHQEQ